MNLQINIDGGEAYGFPRQLPERLHNLYQNSLPLKEWFLEQGYPNELYEQNKWTITTIKITQTN